MISPTHPSFDADPFEAGVRHGMGHIVAELDDEHDAEDPFAWHVPPGATYDLACQTTERSCDAPPAARRTA